MNAVSMAPSMIVCATWMPCGPSSRAMLCASARSACLAPAKAEKPARAAQARRGAGEEDRAAPARQHRPRGFAADQEAGQRGHLPDLAVDALGGVGDGKRTLAPMLKTADLDRRDLALDARDERDRPRLPCARRTPKPCAWPPSARMRSTSGASLSALRRVTQATKPSRAKRRAIAPPVASPAPTTSTAFGLSVMRSSLVPSSVTAVLDAGINLRSRAAGGRSRPPPARSRRGCPPG